MKPKVGSLLILFLAFFISCSENNVTDGLSKRQLFIEGKNDTQIRSEFVKLPFSDQRELWLDKLNQVQKSNLPKSVKVDVLRVGQMLERVENLDDFYRDSEMKEFVLDLSNKLTKTDFRAIFADLKDYEQNEFINSGCGDCRDVIERQWKTTILLNEKNQKRARTNLESVPPGDELPRCNCDWTCPDGSNGVDCTTRNCETTTTGCGFLFLFSCDGKVVVCGTP